MSRADEPIRSRRLWLRPFRPGDADELVALFRDPCVRRFLLDDALVSRCWVRDEIAASEARFAGASAGLWTIRPVEEEAFDGDAIVGVVGFREFFEPPELQLLYALLPWYQGRGLGIEATRRAVDHAFEVLGLVEVRAAVDVPDRASIALLERLGMESVGIGRTKGLLSRTLCSGVEMQSLTTGPRLQ